MLPVFLINLDSRPDRLAYVAEQLGRLQLPFERMPAVLGKNLSEEQQALYDKARFILEYKKPVTLGEIGCAMSHRNIWQKILDENLDCALILEDDIQIAPELMKFLQNPNHYQQFDFLNLSSNVPYRLDEQALDILRANQITERPNVWQSRTLWRRIEWRNKWRIFRLHFWDGFIGCECDPAPALSSGYILSKKGAQALLNTSQTMYYPVDMTWRVSGGELRQGFLAMPLIVQSLNDSNIEGRDAAYQMSIKQKVQRFFTKTRRTPRQSDLRKLYGWSKL